MIRGLIFVISLLIPVTFAWAAGTQTKTTACSPTFADYQVQSVFKGKRVPANVNQSSVVSEFRTVISEGSLGPPDFAGRYRVVEWGCGAPCASFAIVNQKTGYVYMVPVKAILGVGYRLNSSLFIINPPEMIEELEQEGKSFPEGYSAVARIARTFYFLWDARKRELREIKGCNYDGVWKVLNVGSG